MSTVGRFMVGMRATLGVAAGAIVHYAAGSEIYSLASNTAGPFSGITGQLQNVVPLALAVILFGTWLWVAYGGVQEERARRRVR
jgi:hypothetical protein